MRKKKCKGCNKSKSISSFGKDSNTSDGLRFYCKECSRARFKSYYKENKEKVVSHTNKYKRDNKEYYQEYAQNYRDTHKKELKEKSKAYYQENRDHVLKRAGKWAKENRDRRAVIDHRRRARVLGQLGNVSPKIEEVLWRRQSGKCYYCSVRLSETGHHQEHKVPLSRGGLHDNANICLSCPTCNFRKGSRTAQEFIRIRKSDARTS